MLDACGGAIGFWSIGYALAYGEGGRFVGVGRDKYFLHSLNAGDEYIGWFFQFTFAATAATIVAGTVAERCKMTAYLAYSLMLTAFVYRDVGMIDFAGSGVVHMCGGATALVAAIILGPRKGRFYDEDGNSLPKPVSFAPHSVSLQVLGTFILWVGWYGFNPGSTLGIDGYGDVAALCAVTTTLSAACGCVSSMFTDTIIGMIRTGEAEYDLSNAMNGALGGLVGITANCSVVTPWPACVIGLVSGWVYLGASNLLVKLKVDDAVDAIPVHFFCGIWGCIATGLFAEPSRMLMAYGVEEGKDLHAGWFYSWGRQSSDANLLLCQFLGILFIIGWCVGIMFPFFFVLSNFGMFRVDPLDEEVGLDISHHKGSAYDLDAPRKTNIEELLAHRSDPYVEKGLQVDEGSDKA